VVEAHPGVALPLQCRHGMDTRPGRSRNAAPAASRPRPSSGVVLWRPELVPAFPEGSIVLPGPVAAAEPLHRPRSVTARVAAARTMLSSLVDARRALDARAAEAEARAVNARCDRDRVWAAMDTYRIEADLDRVLAATSREVSALMRERGLR
jgi:hypothetical protein